MAKRLLKSNTLKQTYRFNNLEISQLFVAENINAIKELGFLGVIPHGEMYFFIFKNFNNNILQYVVYSKK